MLAAVILALCVPSVASKDACSTGLCQCANQSAHCYNTNLTYIPKFPDNTRAVFFKYNHLPRLGPTTVLNISNTKISRLTLHHNGIQCIDKNVFQNLSQVRVLDLAHNLLTSDSLRNLFSSFQRNSKLLWISLSKNRLEDIPHDVFVDFKSAENITLDLSQNDITLLNMTTFNVMQQLQKLDVSHNKISTVIPGVSQHLQQLSFSNNKLVALPNFCLHRNSYPHLSNLQLGNNTIGNFAPEYINCLEKLKFLYVSLNNIDSLKTDYFHSFKSLSSLAIAEQGRTFHIEERAFNNSKLKKINLSGNILTTNRLDERAFYGLDRLEHLNLAENNFYKMTDKLSKTLAPLNSLKTLHLVGCKLREIPTAIKYFRHLTYLDVSWNGIKSWPNNFFKRNIKLTDLNAGHNSIQAVTSKMLPEKLGTRLKTISLVDNPFVCKCELVWLIRWIHREPHKFAGYPDGYRCLNITERICLNNTGAFISVTTVTCFFICVILIASVINKYIWHIKYHIYMWRYRPKQLLDIAEKHFVHDVFVAYCVQDSDWVLHDLLPIVEEGENIKLCIHERDFLGGQLIIDNIVQHMENSRKVLVVLSNDFARSKWCQFEMSLAQKLVIDRSIESIVVVLLEDIEAVNMSKSLNALLKTTTYINWQNNDNKDIFWQMVKKSLKRQYEL